MQKVIDIISIMPDYFNSFLSTGLISRAIKDNIIEINIINPRDFSTDKHRRVDDKVYGGGAGQLLMPEPIIKAWEYSNSSYKSNNINNKSEAVKNIINNKITGDINNVNNGNIYKTNKNNAESTSSSIIMSASGKLLNSSLAKDLAKNDHLIIICGRYEGIDARVAELTHSIEVSIGDYILSGGEIASIVLIETICRYYPNFLGNTESLTEESYSDDLCDDKGKCLLEYSQYTKPQNFRGLEVPEILLNGNHKLIKEWRLENSISKTIRNRPEFLSN
ncbi:MAG: tRNA (guanosine(37)-N1)-methyltransferase TrmD [Candidatus Acididesulfobacter diazotrophicus]|uniref:tRNA (guanine-N(1)-)-methyltransferase n=1 Tax=Candidatus Acididesulfobacter diazotrophicus TaxID=2597226 RepID=A0A519BK39_9DELT|nr:MAG: tRNA (guanosine(37)-N1)-methyltransferase TrmD [Candidatus Acididesulfobacter diazotrophicus]